MHKTNETVNVARLLRKREYRQSYKEKTSLFQEQWCRSKRSIHTLGFWKELEGHEGCVNTINFNKTGDLLVSGSDDTTIKIWNVETQKCLETLKGHVSNVFAADFLPYSSNKEIISGGNDSDMRHYDLEKKACTVYKHHMKKVLRLSINPIAPDTFLSCSADGTIRMIDVRQPYPESYVHTFDEYDDTDTNDYVLPQAFGGGRASRIESDESCRSSLILDYRLDSVNILRRRRSTSTLFSVDFHPDGNRFIVGSACGHIRLFDLRKIIEHNHEKSQLNIYRNFDLQNPSSHEITGCVFSKNGTEIVATALNDFIYVFDVETKNGVYSSSENSRISTSPGSSMDDSIPENSIDIETPQEEKEENTKVKTYKNVYKGHCSSKTIKGVNFYGPNSEFVITGSDDALIYIWDKETAELLTVLEGHYDIVNCIVGHPTQPLIASSGIDNVVKLWQNIDDFPSEKVLKKRKIGMEKRTEHNANIRYYQERQLFESTVCIQQ